MDLDQIDFEIVSQLRNNARLTNKELAARIGLAPSTTLVRTRQLERCGVLRGYRAEVNLRALGVGLQALISVRLKQHTTADVERFRDYALAMPEMMRLYHVAGEDDFLIHVGVRDSEELRELAMTSLTTRAEVAHIETGLIFECTEGLRDLESR